MKHRDSGGAKQLTASTSAAGVVCVSDSASVGIGASVSVVIGA